MGACEYGRDICEQESDTFDQSLCTCDGSPGIYCIKRSSVIVEPDTCQKEHDTYLGPEAQVDVSMINSIISLNRSWDLFS